jgi:hypothetical protein
VPNYDSFYKLHSDGTGASWGEVKQAQLKYGDTSLNGTSVSFGWDPKTLPAGTVMKGYPASRFPALRCFWHMAKPDDEKEEEVMNLSYMGNVFKSVPQWEFSAHQ